MCKYLIFLLLLSSCEGDYPCDCYTKQGTCIISDNDYLAKGCYVTEKAIDLMNIEDIAGQFTIEFVKEIKYEIPVSGLAWCQYSIIEYNYTKTICHELYHLELCTRWGIRDYNHEYYKTWENPCTKLTEWE